MSGVHTQSYVCRIPGTRSFVQVVKFVTVRSSVGATPDCMQTDQPAGLPLGTNWLDQGDNFTCFAGCLPQCSGLKHSAACGAKNIAMESIFARGSNLASCDVDLNNCYDLSAIGTRRKGDGHPKTNN